MRMAFQFRLWAWIDSNRAKRIMDSRRNMAKLENCVIYIPVYNDDRVTDNLIRTIVSDRSTRQIDSDCDTST
jgi:hypothetical protein